MWRRELGACVILVLLPMQIKVLSFLELVAEAWFALGFWVLMQLPFLDLFEPVLVVLLGIGV